MTAVLGGDWEATEDKETDFQPTESRWDLRAILSGILNFNHKLSLEGQKMEQKHLRREIPDRGQTTGVS